MADTRLQRAAKANLKLLLVWAAGTILATAHDYQTEDPSGGVSSPLSLIIWTGVIAYALFVHYLVVAAWPSRARWIYFWIMAVTLSCVGGWGVRSTLAPPAAQALSKPELLAGIVFVAAICLPLIYMRLFRPGGRPKRRR